MALESQANLGFGGTGMYGSGSGSTAAIVKELSGLKVEVLAGAAAGTKINLPTLRMEDTIIGALNNNVGTITDIKSTIAIEDVRASGTITIGTQQLDGDTVTVNSVVYTAKTTPSSDSRQYAIGGTTAITATNLANAINRFENDRGTGALVKASVATNIVTVKAVAEGAGPNAYTLVGNARAAASSTTLQYGTTTGGFKSSVLTNQVILFYFDKK